MTEAQKINQPYFKNRFFFAKKTAHSGYKLGLIHANLFLTNQKMELRIVIA